ncbi:MAG: hypothetical protein ACFCVD_03295 [Nodosilinea sp.]
MATILIEAVHSTPLIGAQLTAFLQRSQDCLKARHIQRLGMYISPSGTRTLCEMAATDADTVREACYAAGAPFEHIWAADVIEFPTMELSHGTGLSHRPAILSSLVVPAVSLEDNFAPAGVARILVSSLYTPPLAEADFQEMRANPTLHPCLAIRRIQKLRTLVSKDRRRSICEFSATDADSLREAFRQENVPFEQVWTARLQPPA